VLGGRTLQPCGGQPACWGLLGDADDWLLDSTVGCGPAGAAVLRAQDSSLLPILWLPLASGPLAAAGAVTDGFVRTTDEAGNVRQRAGNVRIGAALHVAAESVRIFWAPRRRGNA